LAAAGIALSLTPHVPGVFVVGILTQKLFIGMSDAALSALILAVIGRSAAATKYTVLAALGEHRRALHHRDVGLDPQPVEYGDHADR
jgi:hypothetical protein